MADEVSQREYWNRIHRVLDYIGENLSENLDLNALSKVAFFSPYHFHRIFTAFIGENPDDYIRRLRLEKAANMLNRTQPLSITEIAFQCGFSSSSVFARNFKKHFSMRPVEWKNSKNRQIVRKNAQDFPPQKCYPLSQEETESTKLSYRVQMMEPIKIAYIRYLKGYDIGVYKAFEELMRWAKPRDIVDENTKYLGIAWDNPNITPENKCRFYAGMTVGNDFRASGKISEMTVPGGKYLVAEFHGKPREIFGFYMRLYQSILPENGFVPDDFPDFSIYHTSPQQMHPESDVSFDVYVPVKPLD